MKITDKLIELIYNDIISKNSIHKSSKELKILI